MLHAWRFSRGVERPDPDPDPTFLALSLSGGFDVDNNKFGFAQDGGEEVLPASPEPIRSFVYCIMTPRLLCGKGFLPRCGS